MKMNMTRAAGCAALFAGAAALLLILPDVAFAQGGGDITAGAQRGYQWLVNLIRVLGAIIILAGFVMFGTGSYRWQSGIVMLVGLLGAVKSDAIAAYFLGA